MTEITNVSANANNGRGDGMVGFLEWITRTGQVNQETGKAHVNAARQVLSVHGEDLAGIDVRDLDVDDTLDRFENLHRTNYTPGSLRTYSGRFRKAHGMYMSFLTDPKGWRAAHPQGLARRVSGKTSSRTTAPKSARSASSDPEAPVISQPGSAAGVRFLDHTFPLRPDEDVYVSVRLPTDLDQEEAAALSQWIGTLVRRRSRPSLEALSVPEPEPCDDVAVR